MRIPNLNRVSEGKLIESEVRAVLNGVGEVDITRQPYFPDKEYGVVPETDIRTDKHEVLREAIEASNEAYMQAHQMRLNNKFIQKDETEYQKVPELKVPENKTE